MIVSSEARGLAESRLRRTVLDNCTDPRPWIRRGHQKVSTQDFFLALRTFIAKKMLGFRINGMYKMGVVQNSGALKLQNGPWGKHHIFSFFVRGLSQSFWQHYFG